MDTLIAGFISIMIMFSGTGASYSESATEAPVLK
jgi:hypothetical protein